MEPNPRGVGTEFIIASDSSWLCLSPVLIFLYLESVAFEQTFLGSEAM